MGGSGRWPDQVAGADGHTNAGPEASMQLGMLLRLRAQYSLQSMPAHMEQIKCGSTNTTSSP